jgi:4-amino-4-deoxy-L-arabinose transferase-like glycosyltransferase
MWFWTKLFGTSTWAIRLPVALLGIASVLLVYILAFQERDRLAGLLAAGMLALNGLHIYWSQTARMYPVACFLGLAATIILLRLTRPNSSTRWLFWLYVGTILAGLLTVVYFWLLLATHILWVVIRFLPTRRAAPGLLHWQLLAVTLGTPLLALVAFQSRYRSPTELSGSFLESFARFFQFGFLLEPTLFQPVWWLETTPRSSLALAGIGVLIAAAALLLAVVVASPNPAQPAARHVDALPRWLIPVAGAAALAAIGLFLLFANAKDPSRNHFILLTGLLPPAVAAVAWFSDRLWLWFHVTLGRPLTLASERLPLTVLLAIAPVTVMVAATLFAPRAALIFVPFLLMTLAMGLSTLLRRSRGWLVLLVLLAVLHGISAAHYKQRLHEPTDYQALARQWTPLIEKNDLIFMQRHWATTPIFYYLNPNQYTFVGYDYPQYQAPRIWVLTLEDVPNPPEMTQALAGYRPVTTVEALGITARLFGAP